MARGLEFRIYDVEGFYYLCSENKGADQLRGYREADLRLCFRICKKPVFSGRGSINISLKNTPIKYERTCICINSVKLLLALSIFHPFGLSFKLFNSLESDFKNSFFSECDDPKRVFLEGLYKRPKGFFTFSLFWGSRNQGFRLQKRRY